MAAATAAREDKRQDGILVEYPVKASTALYKGTMIVDLGTGYASNGTDGSGYTFLGVAYESADNSAVATDGAKTVRIWKSGVFEFNKASAVQTDIGTAAYITDNQTVAASTTNSVLAGYIVGVPSSTKVLVRIDLAAK